MNGVGANLSIHIQYLNPVKIVVELYHKRIERDVLKDMRVVWKEDKRMNSFDQWCILLYHVNYEGMGLYAVKNG